jgi:hypothetical protein
MARLPILPTKPTAGKRNLTYPGDLIANGRQFYTQIEFIKYTPKSTDDGGEKRVPQGGMTLPLPKKINESHTLNWEAVSATSMAGSALVQTFGQRTAGTVGNVANAIASGAQIIGAEVGLAINPFLWMLFKSPNFKEHTFSWTFTPHDPQETETVRAIIRYFKFNSSPSLAAARTLYQYPQIALIKFMPNDYFTFKIKPCAVAAVQVDYSGGGGPSFFKDGSPTVVNLTVSFKEIELWTQEDFK